MSERVGSYCMATMESATKRECGRHRSDQILLRNACVPPMDGEGLCVGGCAAEILARVSTQELADKTVVLCPLLRDMAQINFCNSQRRVRGLPEEKRICNGNCLGGPSGVDKFLQEVFPGAIIQ